MGEALDVDVDPDTPVIGAQVGLADRPHVTGAGKALPALQMLLDPVPFLERCQRRTALEEHVVGPFVERVQPGVVGDGHVRVRLHPA